VTDPRSEARERIVAGLVSSWCNLPPEDCPADVLVQAVEDADTVLDLFPDVAWEGSCCEPWLDWETCPQRRLTLRSPWEETPNGS